MTAGAAPGLSLHPVLAPLQGAWLVGSRFRGSCSQATPGYDLAAVQGDRVSADAILSSLVALRAPHTPDLLTDLELHLSRLKQRRAAGDKGTA